MDVLVRFIGFKVIAVAYTTQCSIVTREIGLRRKSTKRLAELVRGT